MVVAFTTLLAPFVVLLAPLILADEPFSFWRGLIIRSLASAKPPMDALSAIHRPGAADSSEALDTPVRDRAFSSTALTLLLTPKPLCDFSTGRDHDDDDDDVAVVRSELFLLLLLLFSLVMDCCNLDAILPPRAD